MNPHSITDTIARWSTLSTSERNHQMVRILEQVKRKAGPLVKMMPSANMRDRARKIYDMAKELQDDLLK